MARAVRSLNCPRRANALSKQFRADDRPPDIDPTIDEVLLAFIEQRKDSMPNAFA